MKYILLGVIALASVAMLHVAAMAGSRLLVARAAGLRDARFFFHDGSVDAWDAAPRWARPAIVVAGPIASYLCASLLFFAAFALGGESYMGTEIHVIPGGPADRAGLVDGDRVVSVGGTPTERWEDIVHALAPHADGEVEIVVDRGGHLVPRTVAPDGAAKIRIQAGPPARRAMGFGESSARAATQPARVPRDVSTSVLQLVIGKAEGELAGPTRIVQETSAATGRGGSDALFFLAALSAYYWPISILVAIVTMPRRRRAAAPAA